MQRDTVYSSTGDINLRTMDSASRFTDWMYNEISPFLGGDILELGSGIGTYSEKIVRDYRQSRIVLSDIDDGYVRALGERFLQYGNVSASVIDANRREDFANLDMAFDSVFALNLLEHIEDDVAALNNIYGVLKPGGQLVILVPAHKFLFNCIDKAIGHYRRYSRQDITAKVKQTRFTLKKLFYFNFAAIPGWYVNGNIFRQARVNEGAVGVFDKIVPVLRLIERYILFRRIGISLIAVLVK